MPQPRTFQSKPRQLKRKAIALMLQAGLSISLISASPALQAAEPNASQHYTVAAGTLGAALSSYATQAGVLLAFDPASVQGKSSPGITGSYGLQQGFDLLLKGSGLAIRQESDGSYALVKASKPRASSENALPEVSVRARREKAVNATEATGSYAALGPLSTATRLPLSVRETPQSISVMTRQRIEDENLRSVESVLDRTPGISIQNIGSSRFSIMSRGYAIENYQLDGVLTTTDIVSQNVPQSQADLIIYDRVEVLRGATALLTGAGDPSGTINLVRKKPTQEFKGYAAAGMGSWDRYRSELDVAGPLNTAGSLRGRLVAAYEKGGTHIDYFKQEKTVLYGVLEADLSDQTLLSIGMDYQKSDPKGSSSSGLPLFYSDGQQTNFGPRRNAAARWANDQIEAYNLFANLEHQFAQDWKLKLSANHLYGERKFLGADASWGYPDRSTGDDVMLYGGSGSARQRQTGLDAQIQGPFNLLGRQHELVLGFNWSDFENLHRPANDDIEGRDINLNTWGNQTPKPTIIDSKLMNYEGQQKQYGTYGAVRFKPRDDLSVILGARISHYQYKLSQIYSVPAYASGNAVTRMNESGVVTPYAGIVFDLNAQHSLYASYTNIFKPQSVRSRSGAVLDPREGDNYEIGLKTDWMDGRLNSTIALYTIRQDNLAEVDPGQTVPGTVPPATAYRAVSGAKTRGLDMELNGELAQGWQISASYNYNTTEDAEGERIRTTFPRQMAKLWSTYRLPGAWHALTLGGGVNWQDRIYYSATTWALPGVTLKGEQERYAVVNLMARYDFSQKFSATLNVNNLFDKEYLQGLDATFNTGIYAPTRNAWLNLRYNF